MSTNATNPSSSQWTKYVTFPSEIYQKNKYWLNWTRTEFSKQTLKFCSHLETGSNDKIIYCSQNTTDNECNYKCNARCCGNMSTFTCEQQLSSLSRNDKPLCAFFLSLRSECFMSFLTRDYFCFNVQQWITENLLPVQQHQLLDSQMDRWCTALQIDRMSSCTSFPSHRKQSYICKKKKHFILSKRLVYNYFVYYTYSVSCATYVHVT